MYAKSKKIITHLGLSVIVGLAGCGGGSNGPNLAIAISVLNSAPIASCPNGGITIQSGIDANGDQILNETEVNSSQFICNGATGAIGTSALSSLLAIKDEPIGANCSSGGSQVNVGLDLNKNSILDAIEITSVSYLCNGNSSAIAINGIDGVAGTTGVTGSIGATGAAGTNGTNGTAGASGSTGATGASGLVSLVSITNETSGSNCTYAGLKVSSGIDTNSDGSLAVSEIQSTKYVCNGAPASTAFAYIYNFREQAVEKDAAIVFDTTGSISGISHENGSAEIGIRNSGIYLISYSVSGTEPNQFALFVNGKILEQSVYGSGVGTQQNNGQVIVELGEKDSITLVNVSGDKAVGLASKIGGDKVNVNASITILKLNP